MVPRILLALLSLGLVLATAPDASARGGRFRAPASPGARGASSADAAPAAPHASCPPPPPGQSPTDLPQSTPVRDTSDTAGIGGRRRRAAVRTLGVADWSYWYEANREEFEDLRGGLFVTEANPLFALGAARGERVGAPERRLDDVTLVQLRRAVRSVLAGERTDHWQYTAGAAYIALGKIAVDDTEVELLLRPLARESHQNAYIRESAALALGQLRRTESRRQLTGTTLDRVRRALVALLADEARAARTRGFAAVSLGLLSDQPSTEAAAGRHSASGLFQAWWRRDLPDETQIGILVGLGLHRPADVSTSVRAALQRVVREGRAGKRSWKASVRAQAAVALGRIGGTADAKVLVDVLKDRSERTPALLQGAVLASGLLGRRLPATRPVLARGLLAAQRTMPDPVGRDTAWIAHGRMLAAEAGEDGRSLLEDVRVGKPLIAAARFGVAHERAFAALGLALAVRAVAEDSAPAWHAFRAEGVATLRAGLGDRNLAPHTRAAFATAIGIAKDPRGASVLLPELERDANDPELRAHAALSLGLLQDARRRVVRGVTAALQDARSDLLRMNAATALGLLGGGSVKDRERSLRVLLEALQSTSNHVVKGRIAITLARIGDARAVKPLVAVLGGDAEQHVNRSVACAALGLLGDEERTPVLSAARQDSYYMGGSSVVFELLDIL